MKHKIVVDLTQAQRDDLIARLSGAPTVPGTGPDDLYVYRLVLNSNETQRLTILKALNEAPTVPPVIESEDMTEVPSDAAATITTPAGDVFSISDVSADVLRNGNPVAGWIANKLVWVNHELFVRNNHGWYVADLGELSLAPSRNPLRPGCACCGKEHRPKR